MPPSAISEPVTICMCTFRRTEAFAALDSLRKLEGIDPAQASVLVIDNDDTDALREAFELYAEDHPLALRYVHAPARNISIARNAALDHAGTRWIAFIDDDETADPHWLASLMERRDEAEVVIGQCLAVYSQDQPRWVARCDFHSTRLTGSVANAYSGNALIDREFVIRHKLRFREELGRTGGEDTLFFRRLAMVGGRIFYAPEAVVHEPVPPARATMRWVRRRMFRAGQTHGLVCREFDRGAYRTLALSAGAKMLFSGAMALATFPGSDASRRWFARASLHAGALRYRLKPAILEEYG